MSRYLVTGATGFLGSHLVPILRSAGHDVVALLRRPSPALERLGIITRVGDVLSGESVKAAAEGCDGLFHCAGFVSWRREDAEALHRVNVDGTKTTLDACKTSGIKKAVVASSSGVVAVSREPEALNESARTPHEIIMRWPYYRAKVYAEEAAFERGGEGFEVVCVNPSLLLGPGDIYGSSTREVVSVLEGKMPFVPAGGLSFVDARDAAQAMALAMTKGRAGHRYLVGAANMSLEVYFGRIARIAGVPGPGLRLPKGAALAKAGAELLRWASKRLPIDEGVDPSAAEMGQHFWYLDATKAKRELGWTHRDPGDTLADMVDDLKARGVVWPVESESA